MAKKRRAQGKRTQTGRRWVRHVQETSDAMDLPAGIFKRSARGIAQGLKKSVEASGLQSAKRELRKAFGRSSDGGRRRRAA